MQPGQARASNGPILFRIVAAIFGFLIVAVLVVTWIEGGMAEGVSAVIHYGWLAGLSLGYAIFGRGKNPDTMAPPPQQPFHPHAQQPGHPQPYPGQPQPYPGQPQAQHPGQPQPYPGQPQAYPAQPAHQPQAQPQPAQPQPAAPQPDGQPQGPGYPPVR